MRFDPAKIKLLSGAMTATITTICRDQDSNLGCRGHNAKY